MNSISVRSPAGEIIGGRTWRRRHGLQTLGDLVLDYRARRFLRPGALVPIPEDRLPGFRGAAT